MLLSPAYSWLEAYILYSVKAKRNFYISLNNPLGGQLKNVQVNVEMIDELNKYVSKNTVKIVFTDGIYTRELVQHTTDICILCYRNYFS